MASMTMGSALRSIDRLFSGGSVAGLSDGDLIGRFLTDRDEAAFAALVARHGPMVLATCRAVVRDEHDAEDAFQATFLILARRAGSIRGTDSLGGWLHRVARRVATRAEAASARMREHEHRAGAMTFRTVATPFDADLGPALHSEIDRLPDRLRRPLVLCDLEGLTRREAAHQLGWTEGTVRGRLSRARALLRARLGRRGWEPSVLIPPIATPVVPPAWIEAATRAAILAATARRGAGLLVGAFWARAFLVAVGLVAAACFVTGRVGPAEQVSEVVPDQAPSPATPRVEAPASPRQGELTYSGRVLDPGGRPFAGARVYLDYFRVAKTNTLTYPPSPRSRATTGPDGRFRFTVLKSEFVPTGIDPWRRAAVVALAAGFGPGVSDSPEPDQDRDLTVRLARDDAPLDGRVLDLEGRPIGGVSVQVEQVAAPAGGSLDPWIEAGKRGLQTLYELRSEHLTKIFRDDPTAGPIAPTTTAADGRFRLLGIGRERVVSLRFEGPTIRTFLAEAMTRRGEPIRLPHFFRPTRPFDEIYFPRGADYVASPTRPVEGTVVDKDTGAPVAGAVVESYKLADSETHNSRFIKATTDAQGRFRLVGLPRGAGNEVYVLPPSDQPYFPTVVILGDAPGLAGLTVAIALKRGIWLRGRLLDRKTGQPITGHVSYHVAAANPHLAEVPNLAEIQTNGDGSYSAWADGSDGSFRVAALPGRGLVIATAASIDYPGEDEDESGIVNRGGFIPYTFTLGGARSLVEIPENASSFTHDFAFEPTRRLAGTVIDPDGQPLTGFTMSGLFPISGWYAPGNGPSFEVFALRPPRSNPLAHILAAPNLQAATNRAKPIPTRTLVFRHDGRRLAGTVEIRGDTPGPLAVKLEPWGIVTGLLIDPDGKPRPRVGLHPYIARRSGGGYGVHHDPGRVVTDGEGRFRVDGLVPGLPYKLYVEGPDGSLTDRFLAVPATKPGATVDLGDVR